MANIVAQAENAFVAVVGGIIRGVAHMEVRVVGNGVPQGAEILVVAEDGDADKVFSVSDLDHGSRFLS